jgi:hypothetical protein
VRVADDAPVCQAFANDGWCDKGPECEERHAWECREYSETGECSKGVKCGLMHVLRAKNLVKRREEEDEKNDEEDEKSADESDAPRKKPKRVKAANEEDGDVFEGQDDFIQFSAPVEKSSEDDETDESVESSSSEQEDGAQEDTSMA